MTNKPTWETRFQDKFTNVMGKGSIYGEERFLSTDDPRDIENFIDDLLAEQRKELIELLGGNKEVYTAGPDKGEEKDHVDSCCNETIDDIINQLKQD